MDYPTPDVIFAIDIGQTCSGVAYSIGPDWCDARILNQWPGFYGTQRAEKVATRLGYSKDTNELKTWGFQCVWSDDSVIIREQFKLALDAEYEDDREFSCAEARQWYCDYLRCLYHELVKFFDAYMPKWRTLRIEYNFSVPTTWKNPAMIARIEELIQQAGFASSGYQIVRMSLTEAEAAAIEACSRQYRPGDIFMIVDAGGGTTDVNLLRVKAVGQNTELEPLDHVEGEPIGSTLIDFHMGQHILDRLQSIEQYLEKDVHTVVEEMLADRFQTIKHSFPDPKLDEFWLDVRGLPGSQTFPDLGIRDSKLSISRATLKDIFDQQLKEMFGLIDDRLLDMQQQYPHNQVSYIILSGGFGSSPYLFQELQQRYMMNSGFRSRNTADLRIMKVPDPQLAVVRGLVKDRTQQLGTQTNGGKQVFQTRRCRNSYGVVVRSPYDETRHRGLPVTTDPSGNVWVERLVDWLIRQGDEIQVGEGKSRQYSASIAYRDRNLPRQARIVMSAAPANQLPQTEGEGDCQQVAVVQYELTESDMELRNRRFWQRGKRHWRAEFSFVVNLGPADLKFQILGRNGVLSSNADTLQVQYMDPYELRNQTHVLGRVDSVGPTMNRADQDSSLRATFVRTTT